MALTDYENNIFVVTAQVLNSIFQVIRYNPLVRDTDFRKDSSKDAGGEPRNFQILHCIKWINIDLFLNLRAETLQRLEHCPTTVY